MKTTKILATLVLALGLMFCGAKVSEAVEMGTAFTYQGHLYDANQVANNIYDFEFTLYDDPCTGSVQGIYYIDEVDVIDGYFTAVLDFGSSVFDGNAVWLDIGIRQGELDDPNTYTPLEPRQEITPTPYAILSSNADKLDFLDSTAFASGVHNHDGIYAAVSHSHDGVYALVSHTHDERYYTKSQLQGSGSASVHWNNLTSVPAGFADGVDDVGGGGLWSQNGSDIYYNSGNVGIGVTSPAYDLDIFGAEGFRVVEDAGANSSFIFGEFGETTWDYAGIEFARIDQDPGPSGYLQLSYIGTPKVMLHSSGNSYFNGGNVGIGTATPSTLLEAVGTNSDAIIKATNNGSGNGVRGTHTTSGNYGYLGSGDYGVFGYSSTGHAGYFNGKVYAACNDNSYCGYFSNTNTDSGIGDGIRVYSSAIHYQHGAIYAECVGVGGSGIVAKANGGNAGYFQSNNGGYAGYFEGNVWVSGLMSAQVVIDRTPYPKDLKTAYDAVMSMEPLPDGQYDETDKEKQLDHSKLSDFIRSKDGNRDLSATVSCLNEVVKDLVRKVEDQQRLIKIQNTQIQEMAKKLQTNNQPPAVIAKGAIQ